MDVAVPITTQRPRASFVQGLYARHYRVEGNRTSSSQQFLPAPAVLGCAGYRFAAVPPTADQCQARYFVRLLSLRLRRIDYRIEKCRREIALSEAAADIDNVIGFRELMIIEQQERRTVEGLIANLRRRFDLPNSGPNCGAAP